MTMATRPRTRSDYQRAVERSRADTLPAIAVTRTPTTIPAPASAKRRIALSALDDDDRALLALVDGKRTVGSIIEWTGQTASKVGARLLRLGVIAF